MTAHEKSLKQPLHALFIKPVIPEKEIRIVVAKLGACCLNANPEARQAVPLACFLSKPTKYSVPNPHRDQDHPDAAPQPVIIRITQSGQVFQARLNTVFAALAA